MLDYFFSLPDDENDSENEQDEGCDEDFQDISSCSPSSTRTNASPSSIRESSSPSSSVMRAQIYANKDSVQNCIPQTSEKSTLLPQSDVTISSCCDSSLVSPQDTLGIHPLSQHVVLGREETRNGHNLDLHPAPSGESSSIVDEAHEVISTNTHPVTATASNSMATPVHTFTKLRSVDVASESSGWSSLPNEFVDQRNIIENTPKPTKTFSKTDKEIDFFSAIMDDRIISHIVKETNLYASQGHQTQGNGSGCRPIQNWVDTSSEEIRAFFGLLIIMGIHQLPQVCNYWSADPILGVEAVSKVMTLKRFKKLVETLHINENSQAVPKGNPGYDKLHKVRPLVTALNGNCFGEYKHSNRLSVDESMIPFKGRSSLKQYMPMKPVKRGYKVWCLADALTGYILQFDIYRGKEEACESDLGLGEKVVLDLCKVLAHSDSIVTFDNFFTTYKLMVTLLENRIYSVGTVRVNRKGLPETLKTNDKLIRGEFMFSTKGPVSAIKWQDSKAVTILSTATNPRETTHVQRKNKDGTRVNVSCPTAVKVYNSLMGGVDLFDQNRERYAVGRRSLKWWHRIFYFLLDLAIVNAFTIMKCVKGEQDQLSFRIRLARQLIAGFSSKKRRGRPPMFIAKKSGSIGVPQEVRTLNVGDHLPKRNSRYRRCRLCSTRKKEKRTRVECTHCKVALCLDPCFRRFHEK